MVRALLDALDAPDHPVVHGPERPGDVRRLLADVSRRARGRRLRAAVPSPTGSPDGRWYAGVLSAAR